MGAHIKTPFSIRAATNEDCAGILECLQLAFASYRESYTPDAFLDTVLTPETLRSRLAEMSIFVAIGTSGSGEIVGTIACKVLEEGVGHLRGMAVRPDSQGSGLGKSLLRAAEDALRMAGCKIVTLDTTEPLKNAIRLYEKNCFRPTGRIGCFFGMPLIEYSKQL